MAARGQKGVRLNRGRIQLDVGPQLTRKEIKRIQDRAASDLRSINQTVSALVCAHLRKPVAKRRGSRPLGSPTDRRTIFRMNLWLTPGERRELKARALEDHRSLSGYVAKLIVEELRRER